MPRTLYVLRCGQEYYVGTTDNVEHRVHQHRQGQGALWTMRWIAQGQHQQITLVDQHTFDTEQEATDEETRTAAQYIINHGILRVRGGPFIEPAPSPPANVVDQWVITIGHVLRMDFGNVRVLIGALAAHHAPAAVGASIFAPSTTVSPPSATNSTSQNIAQVQQARTFSAVALPPARASTVRVPSRTPAAVPLWQAVDPAFMAFVEHSAARRRHRCRRCGRDHRTSDCYASYHVDGWPLD